MNATDPRCDKHVEAQNTAAGTTVTCPTCGREFSVPQRQPTGTTESPQSVQQRSIACHELSLTAEPSPLELVGKEVWGMELLLDLKGCDPALMTQEKCTEFFVILCDLIHMKRIGKPLFWANDSGNPCLHGPSAYQYIETSNVSLHFLTLRKAVYVNIFSCKKFDPKVAETFCVNFWRATSSTSTVVPRL